MSIIHDALKKAEFERQSTPLRLSTYRSANPSRRRWSLWATASVLIGAISLGGAGVWRWMAMPDPFAMTEIAEPIASRRSWGSAERAPETSAASERERATPDAGWYMPAESSVSAPTMADATNAESAFAMARAAEANGRGDVAIALYRQAMASHPQPAQVHNHLGKLLVHQGEIAEAIARFQAALAIDANYVLARNNLGSAYLLSGKEGLAIQEFLATLRIDNAYVSPYYNLALLYARRRDLQSAIAFLTKAVALDPNVLSWVRDEPDFDSIRGAPELRRLQTQRQASR